MIVLIDNYDSFSYNLYQLIGTMNSDITVIRNDEKTVEEIEAMNPSHIIISPGPGRPEDAGVCREAIRYFAGKRPILGVCLGHQAICQEFGATVSYAKQLMHGKQSEVDVDIESKIFRGLEKRVKVARYHSLIAVRDTIPEELIVTAKTDDGEIMAVKHRDHEVYGLQFHPESILTPEGHTMIRNFLEG
ncbi:anthranilate synthase component II [Anaerosporobacter sp.]|uniref:anthranilate synthase component II n=1 Tax=Anaerosporobacter sp. TaxID=1872529 RepID=UPI00286F486B|nr:aminodeoxychorismate/anthranilate synthase component II [Anaerosporobacter sp.]